MNGTEVRQKLYISLQLSELSIKIESYKYTIQKLLLLLHQSFMSNPAIWIVLFAFLSTVILGIPESSLFGLPTSNSTTYAIKFFLLSVGMTLVFFLSVAQLYFYVREKWIGLTLYSSEVNSDTDYLITIPKVNTSGQDMIVYLLVDKTSNENLFKTDDILGDDKYLAQYLRENSVTFSTLNSNKKKIRDAHIFGDIDIHPNYSGAGIYLSCEDTKNTNFVKFRLSEGARVKLVLVSSEMGT